MSDAATSIWILNSQLSHEDNSALRHAPDDAPVVMVESLRLAQLLPHSRVRLTMIWSAMRHFAKELRQSGRVVDYHAVTPEPGPHDDWRYADALRAHIERHDTRRLLVMTPADWRLADWLPRLERTLGIPVEATPNTLFLNRPPPREPGPPPLHAPDAMARAMRRRYSVLIEGDGKPVGGEWRFEPEGRAPDTADLSPLPATAPDEITREVISLVQRRFPDRVGDLDHFHLPVTRRDALEWLEDFIEHRLPHWAEYQDTVRAGRSIFGQAMLSPALNLGLLSPLEVVARVERAHHDGHAPLPAAVGFIRQIMGVREHVHAFHWAHMPDHADSNFFEARRPLPRFFWTGETRCACLADTLRRALDTGHVNHTERLMILGNFLLLIGVAPREAHDWFFSVFADAWEWALGPNVLGLALWADGGLMASKPYITSARHIAKISDHCARCTFAHTKRAGPNACPFNFLHWHFLDRHRRRLHGLARMQLMLASLAQRDPRDLAHCAEDSVRFLAEITPQ